MKAAATPRNGCRWPRKPMAIAIAVLWSTAVAFARELDIVWFCLCLGLGLAVVFASWLLLFPGIRRKLGWRRSLLAFALLASYALVRTTWVTHWSYWMRHRSEFEAALRDHRLRPVDAITCACLERDSIRWAMYSVSLPDAYWIVYDPSHETDNDRRAGLIWGDWYYAYH